MQERLKTSHRGKDKEAASSFNNLLLIKSGPVALPIGNDFITDSTDFLWCSNNSIDCIWWSDCIRGQRSVSKCVCSVKKIFSMFAFSLSDE